jgi:hypothetical protein
MEDIIKCKGCQIEKNKHSDFYKNNLSMCKSCKKITDKERHRNNIEILKEVGYIANSKRCGKCDIVKDRGAFRLAPTKTGLSWSCKDCEKERERIRSIERRKEKDIIKESNSNRIYRDDEEKICSKCKIKKPVKCFSRVQENINGCSSSCKECQKDYRKIHYNKISAAIRNFKSYHNNKADKKQKIAEARREYNKREYVKIKIRIYENTPQRKISTKCRIRIYDALKDRNVKKTSRSSDLVGCTWKELYMHLESKFAEGMSWENYGVDGWHIDHIIPCAAYDLTLEEEQRKCFNFKNLQPMWERDNLEKGDRISLDLIKSNDILSLLPINLLYLLD